MVLRFYITHSGFAFAEYVPVAVLLVAFFELLLAWFREKEHVHKMPHQESSEVGLCT